MSNYLFYLITAVLYCALAIYFWRTRWAVPDAPRSTLPAKTLEQLTVLGALGMHGTLLYGAVFAGGGMRLDPRLAEEAIAPLAEKLALSLRETALGIVRIVNASMMRAIRVVSIERGHDPRIFTLMPFGGAGALHAVEIARGHSSTGWMMPKTPGSSGPSTSTIGRRVGAPRMLSRRRRIARVPPAFAGSEAAGLVIFVRFGRIRLSAAGGCQPVEEPVLPAARGPASLTTLFRPVRFAR